MKIRVADYLAQQIALADVRHVFMISGGGAMHLNDAIGALSCRAIACYRTVFGG